MRTRTAAWLLATLLALVGTGGWTVPSRASLRDAASAIIAVYEARETHQIPAERSRATYSRQLAPVAIPAKANPALPSGQFPSLFQRPPPVSA